MMRYHWGLGVGHLHTPYNLDNSNQGSLPFEQPDGGTDHGSDSGSEVSNSNVEPCEETVLDCSSVDLPLGSLNSVEDPPDDDDVDDDDVDDDSESDSDCGLGSSDSSGSDLDSLLGDDEGNDLEAFIEYTSYD